MGNSAPKFRTALATTLVLSMAIPPSFAQAAENANAHSIGGSMEALDASGALHGQNEAVEEGVETAGGFTGSSSDDGGANSGSANELASAADGAPLASIPTSLPSESEGQIEAVAAPVEGDIAINEANFPDPAFRAWLLDAANLKGIGSDGVLSQQEREAVQIIVVQRRGICSIKGIELFPNLIMIDFEGNYIKEVDLSGNPELRTIYLRNNMLESVDFTHNTKLEFIEIFDNRLSEVDLSMLPNLRFVHLDYNDLKVIDLSHNTKLEDDGFVGNNNPLEKVILPKIEGRSFDTFVISELDEYEGYTSTLPEWYTTPDFQEGTGFVPSTVAEREYQPFDGQTLYVKRTPNTYSVYFDPNGGTGSMDSVDRAWDDGMAPLPENTFERFGYRFRGWSLDGQATDPTYLDGQEVENISGGKDTGMKVTLYAVWEPIEESSGHLRSQLSESLRVVYDDLASQLDKLTDPADPSVVQVQVPEGEEGDLERVLFAVLRDHPEYFWIDYAKLAWGEVEQDSGAGQQGDDVGRQKAGGQALHVYALALRSSAEPYFVKGFDEDNLASYRERFEAKVSEIVAGAPSDPVSAVRYFSAWLANNNVYNPSGLGASNFSRTAASGILSSNDPSSGPVCYGYATAMKVLLDRAGIENAYVEGFAVNGKNGAGEQHAWNAVQANGRWYAVDPTWNDPSLSSASPLETYLMVGYDTVTAPSLKGYERFGQNHDSGRSPALRLGFSYPSLEANAAPEVATGDIEVIGDGWSTRYDSLAKGIVAARDGDVVRLWGDANGAVAFKVERELTIDLNGHDVMVSHGAAFDVLDGAALHLANSTQGQSSVSSAVSSAIENKGVLAIDANIKLAGAPGSDSAISGIQPSWGDHAYVRTSTGGSVVEAFPVSAPAAPQNGGEDISKIGDTLDDLVAYVNGAGAPELEILYTASDGFEEAVPQGDILAHSWALVSGPGVGAKSAELRTGSYVFEASVFDYTVRYEFKVSDAALDQLIEDGLGRADALVKDLHGQVESGLVTSYDAAVADKLLAEARSVLAGASSKDEANETLEALLSDLGSIPTVEMRANDLASSWRDSHAEIIGCLVDGSVTLENARDREALAALALKDADVESLRSALPEGMGDADRALVFSAAGDLMDPQVEGLRGVLAAAAWARGASEVLVGLPKPVTGAEVEVLESLLTSFDELSEASRSFVANGDIGVIENLLEEARADAERPGGSESGGEKPGDGSVGPGDGDTSGSGGSSSGNEGESSSQKGDSSESTYGDGGASGGFTGGLHGPNSASTTVNGGVVAFRDGDSSTDSNGGAAGDSDVSVREAAAEFPLGRSLLAIDDGKGHEEALVRTIGALAGLIALGAAVSHAIRRRSKISKSE